MYKLENNVEWTDELKEAFKHNITRAKIIYDGDKVIDYDNGLKDLELQDNRNVPNAGFIGQAVAKMLKANLLDLDVNTNLENKELELYIGADYNGETYYINYGKFIVNAPPEVDVTNGTISITAYDYMIKFNPDYKDEVVYPCTLKELLENVCKQAGVELATTDFANMNFMVEDNQFEGKTLREVLQHIGKCAFSWARIGQDNKLYLDFEVKNKENEIITIEEYKQDGFKKANEIYGPINRVVYGESNIEGQEEKVEDTNSIAENGLHELVINDNYFAYTTEKRKELIKAGNRLFGLEYMPIQQLDLIGLAYLDCNDIIKVIDDQNKEYVSMCLNHTIKYNGALSDSISTEAQSSTEEAYKNTNAPIEANSRTEIVVDRAMRTIRSLIQLNSQFSQQMSLIEQELERIGLKVEDIVDFTRQTSGNNSVFIDEIQNGEGYILKFVVRGDSNYFKDKNVTIVASRNDKNTEVTLDTEDGDNILAEDGEAILLEKESLYVFKKNIELPDILRSLTIGGILYYDELQILQDGTIQIIKRIGVAENGNLYLLDKEETIVLEDTFVIPSEEKGLYYYVDEISNLNYDAEYIIKNEYTDVFATRLELRAGLELKVDTEKLISEINASADIIRLIGQRLIIEMDNFKLDEKGVMEAIAGIIAGFNINENGFYKEYDGKYSFSLDDINLLLLVLNTNILISSGLTNLYNINQQGTSSQSLNILDVVLMMNIINGESENNTNIKSRIVIDCNEPNKFISITNNYNIEESKLGIFSMFYYYIRSNIILCGEYTNPEQDNYFKGVLIDSTTARILISNGTATTGTLITDEEIKTPKLTVDGGEFRGNSIYVNSINTTTLTASTVTANNVPRTNTTGTTSNSNKSGINTINLVYDEYNARQYLEIYDKNSRGFGVDLWSSDKKLKNNIKDTDIKALDIIKQIKHRQFDWKRNNVHEDIGYVAQELQEINPRFVFEVKQNENESNLQVSEKNIIPFLSKAIQEQQEQIENQSQIIQDLIQRIEKLEKGEK